MIPSHLFFARSWRTRFSTLPALLAGTVLACALAGCGGGDGSGGAVAPAGNTGGSGNTPPADQPRMRCAP